MPLIQKQHKCQLLKVTAPGEWKNNETSVNVAEVGWNTLKDSCENHWALHDYLGWEIENVSGGSGRFDLEQWSMWVPGKFMPRGLNSLGLALNANNIFYVQ